MELLVALMAGSAVAAFGYSLFTVLFSEERGVSRRLRHLEDYERTQIAEVEPLTVPFSKRILSPAAHALGRGARAMAPGDYRSRLAVRLLAAGTPGALSVDGVLGIKILVAALLGAGVLSIVSATGRPVLAMILGLGSALLGSYLPDLWINSRIESRRTRIRRALPDMLDMLTIAVEAGLGFDGAVSKLVARGTGGPLAEEFARMLREVQAGMPRRDALRALSDRAQVPELSSFVMAMVQADIFGISVSSVLRTQSRELRVKRRQSAEEAAQKAPAKMVFPLVLCILPATLVVVLGPAVIAIGRAFGLMT